MVANLRRVPGAILRSHGHNRTGERFVDMARKNLLQRILVTALCLVVWRALAFVPMPGIDLHGMRPSESVSVVALGLEPYVLAMAVILLVRLASPRFNARIRGRAIARYRRWEILFLAALTAALAYGRTLGWQLSAPPLLPRHLTVGAWIGLVLTLTGGTLILYGLGQLINYRGIGFTGYSTGTLLIYALDILIRRSGDFAGVVARQVPDAGLYARYLLGAALAAGLVALTVAVTRAVRKVPVDIEHSEGEGETRQEAVPFRLVASGMVVPVVAANALVSAPPLLATPFAFSPVAAIRHIAIVINADWRPDGPQIAVDAGFLAVHAALIVALVIFFAWFWLDPRSIAHELQRASASLPGIGPGEPTARYLGGVATRVSFVGGLYLAFAVVMAPVLAAWVTGISTSEANFDGFAIVLAAWVCVTMLGGLEDASRTAVT